MKPLAVLNADRRRKRAARPAPNRAVADRANRSLAVGERAHPSQALAENDAKDSNRDSYAIPSRILKPNIYYEGHNFAHEVVAAQAASIVTSVGRGSCES